MSRAKSWRGVRIHTVGHSTRTLDELVALVARGAHVEHIIGSTHATPHRLTPFATVRDRRVTYPGEDAARSRLATLAPFHLEATVRVLQRRPGNLVDVWEHDRYLRVL